MASERYAPLLFKGPPEALVASASFVVPRTAACAPEVRVGGRLHALHFHPDESAGCTTLTISLPPATPPGTLEAVVSIDGREHAALIEVAERRLVVAAPKEIKVVGAAGSKTRLKVEVANLGNAPVALERAGALALRRADALSRNVRGAFKEAKGDFVARVVALGEALKQESVAEAAFSVGADFDSLGAGEKRVVELEVTIPEHVDTSAPWTGKLPLLGTTVAVTVEVMPQPETPVVRSAA